MSYVQDELAGALCAKADHPDDWYSDFIPIQTHVVAICQSCPVRRDCLEAAMNTPATEDWGIWGGLTRDQRKVLREKRAAA